MTETKEGVEVQTRKLSKPLLTLIDVSNKLLVQYQEDLYADIQRAAEAEMNEQDLFAVDGWRLDLTNKVFVKVS